MRRGWWGVIALVSMACSAPAKTSPAASPRPVDTQGTVFGPRIIDLAITLDAAARKSLIDAPDTDVPAGLTFTDERGAPRSGTIKIHIKGSIGSTRPLSEKAAFKIKLGALSEAFHLDELTLNNMVQDPTMVHEALAYQVYEAAGVKVPRTGYAHVTLNDEDYGLYLNLETPDERFLKSRFDDDRGTLYEGAHGVDLRASDAEKFELDKGNDPDRTRLRALIAGVDRRGDGVFYGAVAQVDTDSFVRMMAASALLSDWDNYFSSNNYRIYWNSSTHRWHFIPTGLDQTFTRWTAVFGPAGLLFQKCLASSRCVSDYAVAVRDVADRFVKLGLPARLDALLAAIDQSTEADPKKPYDADKTRAARGELRAFIARRPGEVLPALTCVNGGHEVRPGACGIVMVTSDATGECLDMGVQTLPQVLGVATCTGAIGQRWQLTPKAAAFELAPIRGGQVFNAKVSGNRVQILDGQSSHCLAIGTDVPKPARVPTRAVSSGLTEISCSDTPNQKWHLRWSLYQ